MVGFLLVGCVPHVQLTTLGEPDVDLPTDLHAVAARSDGSEVAAAAAAAFTASLADGTRVRAAPDAGPADATVSFAAFEPETRTTVVSRVEREGDEEREVFTVRRTVAVRGTITLERPDGQVLERLEAAGTFDLWEAEGDTREAAEAELPPLEELAVELGASTGTAYARRLAPVWTRVSRPWYAGGDPRMRSVAWSARTGDWDAARRVWREVADDPRASDRARARALHDLAVAYELDGDLRRAWLTARDAADLAPAHRIEEYRDTLEALRTEHRPLLERIALPEEAPTGGEDG